MLFCVCAVLGAAAWGVNSFITLLAIPAVQLAVSAYGRISGVHIALPNNFNDLVQTWTLIAVAGTAVVSAINARLSLSALRT